MPGGISIERLRFAYNGAEIIRGIDLSIERGSFHSLLGPNGSGKTTLVKLISGVLMPTSGSVRIFDESISNMSRRNIARKLAVVPQGTHVAFPFTAVEVVLMGRAPHLGGLSLEGAVDNEIAREAMEMTHTWEFRNRTMAQLSGGEAQRVILARALAQRTDVLLLDEATVFLDIKHQIEIMELIEKQNRERGITVLAVTHDLNMAARFAHRVTLIKEGTIFAEGTPESALTASNIHEVFGVRVEVVEAGGKPGILLSGGAN